MTVSTSKKTVLLVATLASFLAPFMGSSVNIALPAIEREFGIDAVLLGWVVTAYMLAAAMFLVPFGRIADIWGRKKVFAYGTAIYTISSLLAGLAPSVSLLIGWRILQGIGGSMIFGTGVAILTSVFPAGERGKAIGINTAAVYMGLSLGPVLGGFLTQNFGWRSIFLANVPLGVLILVLVFWKLSGEWAAAQGERFDLVGSVIYSVSLAAIMYGFTRLPETVGVWLLLAGGFGLAAFTWQELRSPSPVLNLNLFRRNLGFAFSNLAALVNYSATAGVGFLLSLYLQYIKGLSPQAAGFVLVSQPLVMALFSPLAGRLSDRIEPGIVASIGMGLTTIGLVLFAFLNSQTPLTWVVASLVFVGLGFALFSSPNTNAVMSSVEKRFYGVASATLGTMRLIGQMLSLGIAVLIFALYMGRVRITPEYYTLFLAGMRVAFIIFAVLCFGGIFASLARGRIRPGGVPVAEPGSASKPAPN